MALFSFILMFSSVLGVSMMVPRKNFPNCTVRELKKIYRDHIHYELKAVMEQNCTDFSNASFSITVGDMTWLNSTKGFEETELSTYDASQILDSIWQHAKKIPLIQLIPARETTLNVLNRCTTTTTDIPMHQRGKRSRRRRNVHKKHMCLQILGLRELWRIFIAHPNMRDPVRHRHTKSI